VTSPTAAEISALVATVRSVGALKVGPLAREVDQRQLFSRELWDVIAELGITALPFAARHGGVAGSYYAYVVALEELAFYGAVAAAYTGPTVQVATVVTQFGDESQIERWARPLIAGGKLGAWAFTEPQTGSDPKQIRTRAVRDGGHWVLDGRKAFISFAADADFALVFARTADRGLGAFVIETDDLGWKPGVPIQVLAFGGLGTAEVAIENVRVPDDHLVGGEVAGFDIMVRVEAQAKVRAGAICVGIARRALEEAVKYASQRTHRNVPIGDKFPTVQATIGQMSASVDAARSFVHAAAASIDRGDPLDRVAASARIVASRMAQEVTDAALQVCGAYGLTKEMVVERLYREGKFYEVGQGVIELQRLIVGKGRMKEFARAGRLEP
jgi:alkylation response protein AidB-like acyl-CoA dehydrogenase